jgi:threonine dehydratase
VTTAAPAPARTSLVTLDDLEDAARVLRGVVVRTPLLPVSALAAGPDAPVWVKPEMLQPSGAFKLRGAYYFLSRLSEAERARGVVAPSSGNHAQAIAMAAALFGVKCTVVMPTTVTAAKREGAARLGARVELAGTKTHERLARAEEIVEAEGATLVPPYDHPWIIAGQGTAGLEIVEDLPEVATVIVPVPYDHPWIIAGQGTAGLEIVEDLPEVATVIVPVGGGGLSAGVAAAVKLRRPEARVIAVEPTGAPKLARAREAGRPVRLPHTHSLADGLMAVEVGHLPFAHHERFVDEVVSVDDDALIDAMRLLLDRTKLVTEPSGAITVAALMSGRVHTEGPTVAVLSGGNIEWPGLLELLGGR